MRKNKKVLSLLLALVMVFATAVPAFATGKLYDKIEVHTLSDGKLAELINKIKVTEDGTDISSKFESLDNSTANKGKYHLGENLKADTTYVFEVKAGETVVEGTPTKYEFKTDAAGKVDMSSVKITYTKVDGMAEPAFENNILHFNFVDTSVVNLKGGDYLIQLVNKDKKPLANKYVQVYNVKAQDGKYLLDKDTESYIVDWSSEVLDSCWMSYFYKLQYRTDSNGQINIISDKTMTENWPRAPKTSYPALSLLKYNVTEKVTPNQTGYGEDVKQRVVAIVYDPTPLNRNNGDEIFVFTDLNKDGYALLSEDKYTTTLEVTVKGVKNAKEEPVEGAVVKVYPNTTELWGPESYDEKPIAEGKTGAHGVVTFKDLDLENIMRYLSGAKPNGEPNYTEIKLPFKVVVEETPDNKWTVPTEVEIPFRQINFRGTTAAKVTLLPGTAFGNRLAGKDRLETAVKVAEKAYPDGAENNKVVIASGYNFADSLVANGIVGIEDAPLLLSSANALPESAMKYLAKVGAKEAVIVGGTATVNANIEKQLHDASITTTRVYGSDRFATSAKVLDYVIRNYLRDGASPVSDLVPGEYNGTVMLANGRRSADALVASVPSAIYTQPILLTETDTVPSVVKAALADPYYQINKVMVVGGTASVSNEALAKINISNIDRLSGNNRQLTSMEVADEYFTHGGQAIIANGQNDSPDALSAGQLGFVNNAPVLLADSSTVLGEDLVKYLKDNRMTEITIVGGTGSISEAVAQEIANLLVKR
ncbi:MAG TPA: cell wall-binding repeat-containing protein [Gallicola sp.]|nr:cell wall-binding repeat-containing protein [Gallicola sp.]